MAPSLQYHALVNFQESEEKVKATFKDYF